MTLLTQTPATQFPLTFRVMDREFTVVDRYGVYYMLNEQRRAVRVYTTRRELTNALNFAIEVTAEYDRREAAFRAIAAASAVVLGGLVAGIVLGGK